MTAEQAAKPDGSRFWLLTRLLSLYDADVEAMRALRDFYAQRVGDEPHRVMKPLDFIEDEDGWATDYLRALRDVAVELNLHRLHPHNGGFSGGERLIHSWAQDKARGYDMPLASGNIVTTWWPVSEQPEPWYSGRAETAAEARQRTEHELRERLHRLNDEFAERKAAAVREGTLAPTATAIRDVGWLYRKLRGASFGDIAKDEYGERDSGALRDRVQRAVQRMADRLGVDRTAWG